MVALTGTLREQGEALEEKEVALQNMGATLKEKEASLSSLEEAARAQREEAQRNITGEYLRVFVDLFLFVADVDFLCSAGVDRRERVSRAREGGCCLGQFSDQPSARTRRSDCRTRQEHLPPRCPTGSHRGLDALPHGSPEGAIRVRRSR